MKKIIYIILGIFLMVACTDDHLADIPTQPKEEADGNKVTLNFAVTVPEAKNVDSRAFGETATISKMYVVVFDGSGMLSECAEATLKSDDSQSKVDKHTDINHLVKKNYEVTLTATDQSRIIHFVAYDEITNDPLTNKLDPNNIQYASENTILGEELNVDNERDVYWQRIRVSAISKDINDNAIVPQEMQLVHLVRNFAKITVDNNATNFTFAGFVVVNTESHGTIAPYNGTNGFANYVSSTTEGTTTTYSCISYDNLVNTQKFTGSVPSVSTTDINIPETPETITDSTPDPYTKSTKYVYERTHNAKAPTYVIVKGTWGGTVGYYKVDILKKGLLATESGDPTPDTYYHILRNFAYNIVITAVTGSGYETAAEAAAQPASNNISASVLLQPLANISDGTSRLFVNYTEKILISRKQSTVDLEYMYLPNATSTTTANSDVYIIKGDGKIIGDVTDLTPSQESKSGNNTGYWTYTIPVGTSTTVEEQTVTVFVPGGLQRTVIYKMIPQAYSLSADCWDGGNATINKDDNSVPANMNKKLTVSVTIPADLPACIFPLTFVLGSDEHSLYSDAEQNSLPVRTGANVIPGNSTSNISFAFEKELTRAEYDGLVTAAAEEATTVEFLCYFKTNKAESASNIYVYNEYFNLGQTDFENSEAEAPNYTEVTIPRNNLLATENIDGFSLYNDKKFTIYKEKTDDNTFSGKIGECTFSYWYSYGGNDNYRLTENLTLEVPNNTTLYFVIIENQNTYYGSMSSSDLIDAENASKTLNNIQKVGN